MHLMQNFPDNLVKAELILRVNRFVAEVSVNGRAEAVYVPNTGRLSELALPGAEVLLSPISGKFRYKILYIISEGYPVMIDSTYSNRLFQELLLKKIVPGLEDCALIRREPAYGNHRFDFLLEKNGKNIFLELKSCTLFHDKTASFPDAVSQRASEHIRLLSETGSGLIVFLVLKEGMKRFIPNYHTDFTFYETLKSRRDRISLMALSVEYDERLEITGVSEIPVLIPEVKKSGIFILLMKKKETDCDSEGDTGSYLLLCGRDDTDVFRRVEQLRRRSKFYPPDSGIALSEMKIISDIPVVSGEVTLPMMDQYFINGDGGGVNIFSSEEWRIYSFSENPAEKKWFWDAVLKLRFGE